MKYFRFFALIAMVSGLAHATSPTPFKDLLVKASLGFTLSTNSSLTGATQDATITAPITLFTNASLTSIRNFSGAVGSNQIIIKNGKGSGAITLINNTGGTAANRILTGTGLDLDVAAGASVALFYDSVNSRWQVFGGSGGGGVVAYQDLTEGSSPASPSAGYSRLFVNTDSEVYTEMSNGAFKSLSGTPKYAVDGDAESGATATYWATYADAAGTTLVDGTGGSPASTWTRSTSSAISGYANFLWTKSAANRQGEGVCNTLTMDEAGKAKVFEIKFDYEVGSGTFVAGSATTDSDMEVNVYDVTNSTFIQPSTYKLYSSTTSPPAGFSGYFQTSATGTQYRVCLHTATTSASAYTLKVDNFKVDRASYQYGTPITDWTSFTPTGAWSANSTYTGFWRRVGDSAQIKFKIALAGAPTAASLTVNLPTGQTIDTAKMVSTANVAGNIFGKASTTAAGASGSLIIGYKTTTSVGLYYLSSVSTAAVTAVDATHPATYANNDEVTGEFTVPIVGWSSNVQMSDSLGDPRLVDFYGTASGTQAVTADVTDTTFTAVKDTHGAWGGGAFTVPTAGDYYVSALLSNSASATFYWQFYINGSVSAIGAGSDSLLYAAPGGRLIPNLKAGDTISVRSHSSITLGSIRTLSIHKVAGPSAIAANELIAARYTNTAGTSIANSGDVKVPFATKDFDTHGAFVTDTFTAPIAGKYKVHANVIFSSQTYAAGNQLYAAIYKNNSYYSLGLIFEIQAIITNTFGVSVTDVVNCVAGDTIDIRVENTRTAGATALATTAGQNHLSIERIGL